MKAKPPKNVSLAFLTFFSRWIVAQNVPSSYFFWKMMRCAFSSALECSIQCIIVESWPRSHLRPDKIPTRRNHELTQTGELRQIVSYLLVVSEITTSFGWNVWLSVDENVVWASIILPGCFEKSMKWHHPSVSISRVILARSHRLGCTHQLE